MPNSQSGFSFLELVIVIAMVAILAVTSAAMYISAQPKARNARRKVDIDAIAKALEAYKKQSYYIGLANYQFIDDNVPTVDSQNNAYCGDSPINAQPADPGASWTGTACPIGYSPVNFTVPATGITTTAWKVCTWLEAANGITAGPYCRVNSQ